MVVVVAITTQKHHDSRCHWGTEGSRSIAASDIMGVRGSGAIATSDIFGVRGSGSFTAAAIIIARDITHTKSIQVEEEVGVGHITAIVRLESL